jgi:hypothetical protein
MLSAWLPIDHMWHMFLLFTEDYAAFSTRHFGYFMHHRPEVAARTRRQSAAAHQRMLVRYMNLIYLAFGARVLRRWFKIYPALALTQGKR